VRRAAVVVTAVVGALTLAGGTFRAVHGPFHHRDACAPFHTSLPTSRALPTVAVGEAAPPDTPGKVHSAAEAEDALLTPPSKPLNVVIDQHMLAQLRAMPSAIELERAAVVLAHGDKPLVFSLCRR
jgi:hypothetical protein